MSHSRASSCIAYYPLFSEQQKRKNPSCSCDEVIFIRTIRIIVNCSQTHQRAPVWISAPNTKPITKLVLDYISPDEKKKQLDRIYYTTYTGVIIRCYIQLLYAPSLRRYYNIQSDNLTKPFLAPLSSNH